MNDTDEPSMHLFAMIENYQEENDDLFAKVKLAREIVPKLSRFIGEMIPWIADEPEGNGIFVGEAVEWDYDGSGEWVLVNYNETRWVTMSYIESVWKGESEE